MWRAADHGISDQRAAAGTGAYGVRQRGVRSPRNPQPSAPLEVIADAAELWTETSDGLTDRFKLREGLKFAARRGYAEADIAAFMHGNWLRLLRETMPQA